MTRRLNWLARTIAINPNYLPYAHTTLAAALALTGHDAEARAALQRYLALLLKRAMLKTIAAWKAHDMSFGGDPRFVEQSERMRVRRPAQSRDAGGMSGCGRPPRIEPAFARIASAGEAYSRPEQNGMDGFGADSGFFLKPNCDVQEPDPLCPLHVDTLRPFSTSFPCALDCANALVRERRLTLAQASVRSVLSRIWAMLISVGMAFGGRPSLRVPCYRLTHSDRARFTSGGVTRVKTKIHRVCVWVGVFLPKPRAQEFGRTAQAFLKLLSVKELAMPMGYLPAGSALKPELFHTNGITSADFAALHYRGVDPNVGLIMLGCCARGCRRSWGMIILRQRRHHAAGARTSNAQANGISDREHFFRSKRSRRSLSRRARSAPQYWAGIGAPLKRPGGYASQRRSNVAVVNT